MVLRRLWLIPQEKQEDDQEFIQKVSDSIAWHVNPGSRGLTQIIHGIRSHRNCVVIGIGSQSMAALRVRRANLQTIRTTLASKATADVPT